MKLRGRLPRASLLALALGMSAAPATLRAQPETTSPLLAAAHRGDLTAVRAFGRSIGAKDERGWDALMFAASRGHVEVVRHLLSHGADPNTKENDAGLRCLDLSCTSDQPTSLGKPVLTIAASGGHTEVVRLLLAAGAKADATDAMGFNALRSAWRAEIVELLVKQGADPNRTGGNRPSALAVVGTSSPLAMAAAGGNVDVVRALLRAGADPNARGFHGKTPLLEAARHGFVDVVQPLVEAGAKVNAQDSAGETALMVAAGANHLEFVKALLAAGANIELTDRRGETAYMKAAAPGRSEMMRLLEQARARR